MRPAGVVLLAGLISLGLGGCELLGASRRVAVELPALPPQWPSEERIAAYRIVWRDPSGRVAEMQVPGDASRVELRLPKRDGVAVLAYPVVAGGRLELRPAAAVYPYHATGGPDIHAPDAAARLVPTYADGFAGLVLHRVRFLLPSVNAARLLEEVREHAAESAGGDPWRFDIARVTEKLSAGSFSTIYLRPREDVQVTVEAAAGTYLSAHPHAAPVVAAEAPDGSGSRLELSVPAGVHRYYRPAAERILSMRVNSDGGYRVLWR